MKIMQCITFAISHLTLSFQCLHIIVNNNLMASKLVIGKSFVKSHELQEIVELPFPLSNNIPQYSHHVCHYNFSHVLHKSHSFFTCDFVDIYYCPMLQLSFVTLHLYLSTCMFFKTLPNLGTKSFSLFIFCGWMHGRVDQCRSNALHFSTT